MQFARDEKEVNEWDEEAAIEMIVRQLKGKRYRLQLNCCSTEEERKRNDGEM
jgi:hypothetical protein